MLPFGLHLYVCVYMCVCVIVCVCVFYEYSIVSKVSKLPSNVAQVDFIIYNY